MTAYTFPRGETVVATCVWQGLLVVATTNRVWAYDQNTEALRPMEILDDTAVPEAETQVFTGTVEGA